jgi:hypothetical protein
MSAETLWIPLGIVFGLVLVLVGLLFFESCQQSESPPQGVQVRESPEQIPSGKNKEGGQSGQSKQGVPGEPKDGNSRGDSSMLPGPFGAENSREGVDAGSGRHPGGAAAGGSDGSAEASAGMGRPDSESKDSSSGAGVLLGPSGSPSPPTEEDLQDALRQARRLFQRAEQHARQGQYGQAYAEALRAWQVLRPFSKIDPECRKLYEQLDSRLREYGEKTERFSPQWEWKPLAEENK